MENSNTNNESTGYATMEKSARLNSSNDLPVNRFGGRSRNMFFVRHSAIPKNLRLITGIGGIQYCAMKEDQFRLPKSAKPSNSNSNSISDPKYDINFCTAFNQDLIKSYQNQIIPKIRKQRILPPIPHYTGHLILADDTKKWRFELNKLGKKIGIMTLEEIKAETEKIKKDYEKKSGHLQAPKTANGLYRNFCQTSVDLTPNRKSTNLNVSDINLDTASCRSKTGRFNENSRSLVVTKKHMLTKGSHMHSNKYIVCDEESEREMWLLQILCQILNTESMQDIQSWLVSSGHQEKEAMKELILKAINGLNASGRLEQNIIQPNEKISQVDYNHINSTINNLIDHQKSVDSMNTELNLKELEKEEKPKAPIFKIKFRIEGRKAPEKKEVEKKEVDFDFDKAKLFKSCSLLNMKDFEKSKTKNYQTFEDFFSNSTYNFSNHTENHFEKKKQEIKISNLVYKSYEKQMKRSTTWVENANKLNANSNEKKEKEKEKSNKTETANVCHSNEIKLKLQINHVKDSQVLTLE